MPLTLIRSGHGNCRDLVKGKKRGPSTGFSGKICSQIKRNCSDLSGDGRASPLSPRENLSRALLTSVPTVPRDVWGPGTVPNCQGHGPELRQ